MAKHRYAFVDAQDNIIHVTEPLDRAPPPRTLYGATLVCQQVVDDAPGLHTHNHHLFERHSPRIVMRADRKVYQEWSLRRKPDA
jgi:hypothetical protein